MTVIKLIEIVDTRTRKGIKNDGEGKYSRYMKRLGPEVSWIKDKISKSPDGAIRIKNDDILNIVGPGVGRHPSSVYWASKYTLFQHGMWVSQGKHKDGNDLLVIRMATKDDFLPPSLANKGTAKLTVDSKIKR